MDTSHNYLREPSCEDYPFIGAKRYIDGLSQPEKEDILASMAKDVGKIRVENIPDEEDLTQVRQGCHHVLKFKDKIFNPAECSGMGKVFLRKNMVLITCDTSKNILTLSMFEDKHGLPMVNTIFIIQYDYDLDGGFITLPENSVLLFAGGSLRNGTVMLRNTLVLPVALDIEHYMSVNIRGAYKEGSLVYLRKKLRLFDGTHWITIGAHDLTPIMNAVKKYLNFALDIVAPFKIELSTEKNYVERGLNNIRVSWSYNRLISNQDIRLESGHDVRIYEELDKNIRSYTFENVELNEPATIVVSTTYKGETVSEAVTLTFDKNPGLVIDDELDENSTNPVTNRAITRVIRSLELNLENFQQYVNETFLTKVDAENTYLKQVDFDLSEVYDALGNKVDKEAGKGLSSNDFTDSLKDKLEGINLDNYALKNHTHTEYADKNHTHSNYADVNHTHSEYATNSDLSNKQDKLPNGRDGEVLKWSNGSWQPGTDEKGSDVSGITEQELKSKLSLSHDNTGLNLVLKYDGTAISETPDNTGSGSDTVEWEQQYIGGTQIAEIKINGNKTVVYAPQGGGGESVSLFKEFIFMRKIEQPDTPEGGTYDHPVPSGWSDGIPPGTDPLWFSCRMFYSNGFSADWSEPSLLADSEVMDVCYSSSPYVPDAPTTHGTQETGPWHERGGENDIWMAISTKNNGDWGPWSIVKIKGEDGKDGSSIKVVGTYNDVSEPYLSVTDRIVSNFNRNEVHLSDGSHTLELGDCLTVSGGNDLDGHIIYLSDTSPEVWVDLGLIKGEAGKSSYLHIKFSNDGGATFTDNDGEDPGKYIGTCVNFDVREPDYVGAYSWAPFRGEDGNGYWYVYAITNDGDPTPQSPRSNPDYVTRERYTKGNFDYAGVHWNDEPQTLTEGQTQWYMWLRDSDIPLHWSEVKYHSSWIGSACNLIFKNDPVAYYDFNTRKLLSGTVTWTFLVNGLDKTSEYDYEVYSPSSTEPVGTGTSVLVNGESYTYITVNVLKRGTTPKVIYTGQYIFPVKGLDGEGTAVQGLQGAVMRNRGLYDPNVDNYKNESTKVENVSPTEIRYIDYVVYDDTYYMVKPGLVSDNYTVPLGNAPSEQSDYWIKATEFDFASFKALIAENAQIKFLDGQEVRIWDDVTKSNKKLVAGMTSGGLVGDETVVKTNDTQDPVRIWAGETGTPENVNLTLAPFKVTESGKLYATDAFIHGDITATSFLTGENGEPGLVVIQNFNTQDADTKKAYLYYDPNDRSMNLAIYDFNQNMWVKLNLLNMIPIGNVETETFYTINNAGSTPAGYVDVQGVTYSKRDGKYYENNTLVTSADVYQKKGSYNIICPVGDGFSYFILSNCIRYKLIEIRNGVATTTNNNLIIGDDYTINSSGTQHSVVPGQYRYPRVYTGTGGFTSISSPNTHIYYITSSFDTSSQNGTIGENVAYKIKNNSEQRVYVATTGLSATDYYNEISQLQSVEAPDLQGAIYPIPK